MRRLATAALLAALACAPSFAWAGTTGGGVVAVGDTNARRQAAPAPVDVSPGEAADYAAREAAAPALGEFAGGRDGIYIGGGAVVVLLLVIIIILIL
jgi:hypothetical protein